ncbi:hypothetical protein V1512DRAFT_246184 [Lipomyces arxii]|uniref:uncharacterized protein n=1 Tax=Lipomyces arxii TaxID=56418 RepID=UPI0034CEACDF
MYISSQGNFTGDDYVVSEKFDWNKCSHEAGCRVGAIIGLIVWILFVVFIFTLMFKFFKFLIFLPITVYRFLVRIRNRSGPGEEIAYVPIPQPIIIQAPAEVISLK